MGLYGGMFSGVSGLNGQSTALAIIADNIANINTVGYKRGSASFSTLVTATNNNTSYSSGGVRASNKQFVDAQGLIQTTESPLDLAISGNGFFVVNTQTTGEGDFHFTRAGSFNRDARGNFVNAAGYTLMGWPLDNEGRLPGQPGNANTTANSLFESLRPVNVKAVSGVAVATTQVSLGFNLDATEKITPGGGQTISFPAGTPNFGISTNDIIVPYGNGADNFLVEGDSITLTPSSPGVPYTFTYGGFVTSDDISAAPILGANTPMSVFTGAADGDAFTIDTNGVKLTFTFASNSPNATKGEFNSLNSLAHAINSVNQAGSGERLLTARIVNNRLYIAPVDASHGMTFAPVGTSPFPAALAGNVAAGTTDAPNRFATLTGLYRTIKSNAILGVDAVLEGESKQGSLQIFAKDPLGTLTFAATPEPTQVAPPTTTTSTTILEAFGLSSTNFVFGPSYDYTGQTGDNMASRRVLPNYSSNLRIYDALGIGHDFTISFLKINDNTWAAEIYTSDPAAKDIISSRSDGQIASGVIQFNGDGTLRSVSTALVDPISVSWVNQALDSNFVIDWGDEGQPPGTEGAINFGSTRGLRQFGGRFERQFLDQNGVEPGLLTGVEVDKDGFVISNFSNGQSSRIFKLPIADFPNPNGLNNLSGNVFAQSLSSGNFNLKEANTSGVGSIVAGALEQSNVELSDELTRMIVAQRGYQASSKVIKTVDNMLEDLNRAIN